MSQRPNIFLNLIFNAVSKSYIYIEVEEESHSKLSSIKLRLMRDDLIALLFNIS